MNKQEVYELFCGILVKNHFSDEELSDELWSVDGGDEYFYDHLTNLDGIADYDVGASKLVLFLDGVDDFVVKIPLHGAAYWYESLDGFDFMDDDVVEKWSKDYCEQEAYVYSDFCYDDDDYTNMLAGTWYVGNYGMVPIYVSEKVSTYNGCKASEDSTSKAEEYIKESQDYTLGKTLLSVFIEHWGYKRAIEFSKKLKKHDADDDICDRNCGLDKFGRIVVLDYSGFVD